MNSGYLDNSCYGNQKVFSQLIYSIYGTGWSYGLLGTDLGKNLEGPVSTAIIMLPWQPKKADFGFLDGHLRNIAQLSVTSVENMIFKYSFKPCDSVVTPLTRPSERVRHLVALYTSSAHYGAEVVFMFDLHLTGTASVAVAGVIAAMRITNTKVSDHKFLFQGAGEVCLCWTNYQHFIDCKFINKCRVFGKDREASCLVNVKKIVLNFTS